MTFPGFNGLISPGRFRLPWPKERSAMDLKWIAIALVAASIGLAQSQTKKTSTPRPAE